MNLWDFYYKYFGETITTSKGYGVVNTLVYVVFALLLYFVVVRKLILKYVKEINFKFFLSVIIFVCFGAMVRVMEESYSTVNIFTKSANPLNFGFWTITPGIYILMLVIFLTIFLIGYLLRNKFGLENVTLTLSLLLFIPILIFMFTRMTLISHFFLIIFSIAIVVAIIWLIARKFNFKLNRFETFALTAQLVDGIATFTALTFYPWFGEQHVVSNFFIMSFGTWIFPVIKIVLTLIIIYVIRKSNISNFDKIYILLFIAIFGFATGFRDIFSIVCHLI